MFIDEDLENLIKANNTKVNIHKRLSKTTKKSVTMSDEIDVIPDMDSSCNDSVNDRTRDGISETRKAPQGRKCYTETMMVTDTENVAECKQQ